MTNLRFKAGLQKLILQHSLFHINLSTDYLTKLIIRCTILCRKVLMTNNRMTVKRLISGPRQTIAQAIAATSNMPREYKAAAANEKPLTNEDDEAIRKFLERP